MLDDKINQLKSTIKADKSLNESEREKLLKISEELHTELTHLEKTHKKDAHKIAEHAHKAANKSSQESVSGLKDAIREFEASHPNLTRIIQTLCAQFGV